MTHGRLGRGQQRVEEEKLQQRGNCVAETLATYATAENYDDIDDELTGTEYEELADKLVDQATAAQTVKELQEKIESLKALENQALQLVNSVQDRKGEELSNLLQDSPYMKDENGIRRKMIIFAEHKDTLNYLCAHSCHRIKGRSTLTAKEIWWVYFGFLINGSLRFKRSTSSKVQFVNTVPEIPGIQTFPIIRGIKRA